MGKYIGATVSPVLFHNDHYMTTHFNEEIKINGKKKTHKGLDLINRGKVKVPGKSTADYIIAIDDGTVSEVDYSTARGFYVTITHKNGYKSRYCHLKANSIIVKVKQLVKKGQTIGYMGATGEVTGVHLHLAILKNNQYIDPLPFLTGDKNFNGDSWELGDYVTLYQKYLRTSAEVKAGNKAKYKNLSASCKAKCIKDSLGYARYKVGVTVNIKEFKFDKKGNKWGRTNQLWLCVRDSNGDQVKKK